MLNIQYKNQMSVEYKECIYYIYHRFTLFLYVNMYNIHKNNISSVTYEEHVIYTYNIT